MKPIGAGLTIETILTGAYSRGRKYAITDPNGGRLILLDSLFDAAICLRFLLGKSMSRYECDLAERLLRDHDEGSAGNEQSTGKAASDDE